MGKDKKDIEKIIRTIVEDKPDKKKTEPLDIRESYGRSVEWGSEISGAKWKIKKYATLDNLFKEDIISMVKKIVEYSREDSKTKRPLSFLLHADPGLGKSYLIKRIVKSIGLPISKNELCEVVFNMGNMLSPADLEFPLEVVRNLKAEDKLPLLFLDEIDSCPKNYSLLLPLLLDGEMRLGHRQIKIGKVIIVLAGSTQDLDTETKKNANDKFKSPTEMEPLKKTDFMSRINGSIIRIPRLDEVEYKSDGETTRDRRADKVCIAVSIIENSFKRIQYVPWRLLHFIATSEFRYGVRSIELLIDKLKELEKEKKLNLKKIDKDFETLEYYRKSNLVYHIMNNKGPKAVVAEWNKLKKITTEVKISATEDVLRDAPERLGKDDWKDLHNRFDKKGAQLLNFLRPLDVAGNKKEKDIEIH